jgi:hypothetical protein
MVPANEGLETADLVGRQIDNRLIVELELAGGQRLRRSHSSARRACICASISGSKAERAAAVALGSIQGKIGVAHDLVGVHPSDGPTAIPMLAPITT